MIVFFASRDVARRYLRLQGKPHVWIILIVDGYINVKGVYPNEVKAQRALNKFGNCQSLRHTGVYGEYRFLKHEGCTRDVLGDVAKGLLNSTDVRPKIEDTFCGELCEFGFFEDIQVMIVCQE